MLLFQSIRHQHCSDGEQAKGSESVHLADPILCLEAGPWCSRRGRPEVICGAHYRDAIGTTLLLNHFSILHAAGVARADALQILSALGSIQADVTLSTRALLDRDQPLPSYSSPCFC